MKYSVVLSPEAEVSIQAISEYISESLASPQSAQRIVQQIMKKCYSLQLFPHAAPSCLVNGRKAYTVHYRRYTIVYTVDKAKRCVYIWGVIFSPHLK